VNVTAVTAAPGEDSALTVLEWYLDSYRCDNSVVYVFVVALILSFH